MLQYAALACVVIFTTLYLVRQWHRWSIDDLPRLSEGWEPNDD
jgi:predicted secreted protein